MNLEDWKRGFEDHINAARAAGIEVYILNGCCWGGETNLMLSTTTEDGWTCKEVELS